jgi:phosphatidylinositol 4-kinase type 2
MVVLDYITRNTDRGNDNWLIKLDRADSQAGTPESIAIAAIDNGLAFPFKHPDNWRMYPYHWSYLPLAKQPFSDATAEHLVPLLEDDNFVEELGNGLRDDSAPSYRSPRLSSGNS